MKKQQTVNDRVRILRESARMTPSEFAVALRLSASLIQKVETGEKPVSAKLADQLITDWGVPEGWLMRGDGELSFNSPASNMRNDQASPWRDEAYSLLKAELESWKQMAMRLAGNPNMGKFKTLVSVGDQKRSLARVN